MSDSRKNILGLLTLIGIFFLVFMIFAVYTVKSLKSDYSSERSSWLTNNGPIGVVEIEGVIMDSKKILETLHMAEKKQDVKAIILRVNSPGGAVGPTQEIYEEVMRINREKKKPVYASFGAVAASGGYYIGAAAKKIYSNPGTITGSIGVIMQFMDMSKLYEWAKVNPYNVKAGKYKDIGSPNKEMTPEERLLVGDLVSNVHEQFRNDIKKNRKNKIKGDLVKHSQGQVFSGEQALKLGLVDELAGLYEAARRIHKELKLTDKFGLQFIKAKKKFEWSDFLQNLDESITQIGGKLLGRVPMFLSSQWIR